MDTILNMFSHTQGAVAVILVLGGLIFFHELGHFFIARVFGVGVRTFSLGFGPRLWSKRVGKTDYCLSLVPLGGYVSMVGEGGEDEETDPKDDRVFSVQETFYGKPAWQRMLVVAAGPVANFILAWIIYFGLALTQGSSFLVPVIGEVLPNSAAMSAGIQAKDHILKINGKNISEWSKISTLVSDSDGQPLDIVVLRGNEEKTIQVKPNSAQITTIFGEKKTAWQIGVKASGELGHTELGFGGAFVSGIKQTWGMIVFTCEGIAKLFQNVVPLDAVGGPILIAQAVGQQAAQGLIPVLLLAALISVNLGLLNLLPIPVLDGGHIVFLSFEMLMRRPVNEALRTFTTKVGVALLLALMVFATWNDIMRLLS